MGRDDPVWAVFMTTVLSHLMMLPSLVQLARRRWSYETALSFFAIFTSFMYHMCQTFGTRFYMSELHWHRLDNIGAISCFGMYFTYLANIKNVTVDCYLKWATFLIAILAQEEHPWNERNTFVPILSFAAMPVLSHICYHQRMPNYDWKAFVLGFGMLGAAVPFFVLGLDDANDPFRFYHGMWHVFGGLASIWLWRIVKQPYATTSQIHSPLADLPFNGFGQKTWP